MFNSVIMIRDFRIRTVLVATFAALAQHCSGQAVNYQQGVWLISLTKNWEVGQIKAWEYDQNPCGWAYVDCDNTGVPAEITNLQKLNNLRLANNQFTGSVPPALAYIPTLTLASNNFSGYLPDSFVKTCDTCNL
eukprot:jgi/Mesen1/8463/ME000476S07994